MAEANHSTPKPVHAIHATPQNKKTEGERRETKRKYDTERQRKYRETHREQTRIANKKYHTANATKVKEMKMRWYLANKERATRTAKNNRLKRYYGISMNEYDDLLTAQNSKCAICDKTHCDTSNKHKHLVVDHRHKTKQIRGLLCSHCNTVLGFMSDDPVLLRKAADYLEVTK